MHDARPAASIDLLLRILGLALLTLLGCHGDAPRTPEPGGATACKTVAACRAAFEDAVARDRPLGPALAALARQLDDDGKPALSRAVADASARTAAKHPDVELKVSGDGPLDESALADAGVAPERVYEALGELAGAILVDVDRAGQRTRVVVRDPLRHELGMLPAAWRASARAGDAATETSLRKVFALAQASDFVGVLPAADALVAEIGKRDPLDPIALRARLLLRRLPLSFPVSPLPAKLPPGTTPYEALLLTKLDPSSDAYALRRDLVLRGFPPEERALVDEIYLEGACPAPTTPSFERPRDLFFAGLLPGRLLPVQARAQDGRLSIEAWQERYARLVDQVSETRTGFLFVTAIMRERGQSAGVVPQSSRAFQRATAIGAAHLGGLTRLVDAAPGRVGLDNTTFLLAPGFVLDPEIRARAATLAAELGEAGIVAAKDSEAVLLAVVSGVLSMAMLPPELHEANLGAIERAVDRRLAGDMRSATGWDVAILYAIDAVYRQLMGRPGDLERSATEVRRALAGSGVRSAELARVAGLVAAYAALGVQGGLGAPVPTDAEILPARRKLRDELTDAVRSLGATTDRADAKLVSQLVSVLDGLIATIILDFGEQRAAGAAPTSCSADAAAHGPRVARALSILADRRTELLATAGLRAAAGTPVADRPFVVRSRALAVIASDLIDVYRKKDDKTTFAVPEIRGREALRAAVAEIAQQPEIGSLAAGAYSFARAVAAADLEFFRGNDAARALAETFDGLGALLADGAEPNRGVAAVFRRIARAQKTEEDLGKALALAAKERFGAGERDQADTMLLVGLAVSALRRGVLPGELIAVADGEKSRLAFALRFMRRIQELNAGTRAGAPGEFQKSMHDAYVGKCAVVSDDVVEAAFRGVESFAVGKRKEARDELRKVVDAARKRGLSLPVYTYAVRDTTPSHDFAFSLGIGSAGGFLSAHTFQVGLGIRSYAEPYYGLTTFVGDADTAEARLGEGRYVVAITGLLAAYAFLDGDVVEGDRAGAELVALLTQQSRLTQHPQAGNPAMLLEGNAPMVARVGVLAAKHNRPLLAGSLLAVIDAHVGAGEVHAAVNDIVDTPPLGLREPASAFVDLERDLKRIMGRIEQKHCGGKKGDDGPTAVSCAAYPEAVALRVIDARKALPGLDTPEACPGMRALDRYLTGAQRGAYDPDALVAAADQAIAEQRAFDAAILLTKHRNPGQCSPGIVERMAKLARAAETASSAKADLLASIVNCGLSTGQRAVDDLLELDDTLVAVGDPMRAFEALLYASGLALHDAAPLQALVSRKDYAERYRGFDPNIRVLVVALGEIAAALTQKPSSEVIRPAELTLLCGDQTNARRKDLCASITALRKGAKDLPAGGKERREQAIRALESLLKQPP